MIPSEPDSQLVARALAGDASAFTTLVRRHQDRVYMLTRGIVRNPDDAADVTQETFLAVVRHLDQFEQSAQFSTWLHRIAVRKAYDFLRKRVPEPIDPASTRVTSLAATGNAQQQHVDAETLRSAIANLDPPFRDAVLLVDVMGASVDEAAAALDIAPGTIKSRCFRGRAALATALGTAGLRGASD